MKRGKMNAREFIEKEWYGLTLDCSRDIETIYMALEDYAEYKQRSNKITEEELFIKVMEKLQEKYYWLMLPAQEDILDLIRNTIKVTQELLKERKEK